MRRRLGGGCLHRDRDAGCQKHREKESQKYVFGHGYFCSLAFRYGFVAPFGQDELEHHHLAFGLFDRVACDLLLESFTRQYRKLG